MSGARSCFGRVLVGVVVLGLGGPGAAADAQPAGEDAARAKPVAPFTIEHEIAPQPMLGVAGRLRITLRPQVPIADVTVQISADPGLGLDASAAQLAAPAATPASAATWDVELVPSAEGEYRIRLYAEAEVEGARQGRSAVIPITVGESPGTTDARKDAAARAAAPEAEETERARDERRVIRLPSSERR